MDIDKAWNEALKRTEIIRNRVQILGTSQDTRVPYILLSESSVNHGDTVVRKGSVMVERPALFLPPHNPQFSGFEFEKEKDFNETSMVNFLLVRGVSIPSMRYDNKINSLDIYEGGLSEAIKFYQEQLQAQENVTTGLMAGPQDYWQFSLLIFVCSQIARNADIDIRKLLEKYHKDSKDHKNL